MYFSAINKAIQNLEEKKFYDIAMMYLERVGYKELSIVDGSGDGGRYVTCSRDDLRIQLSVRDKWQVKINEEAAITKNAGLRHLIFVTNRFISPAAEQDFFERLYRFKGEVEVTIASLRRIATSIPCVGLAPSSVRNSSGNWRHDNATFGR